MMVKIKFYRIFNVDKFIRLIEEGWSSVLWHLPEGSLVDWKRNNAVKRLPRTMTLGVDGLRISLSNPSDMPFCKLYDRGRAAS